MEKLFLYEDESIHRFWRIQGTGLSYLVTYGRVGTPGAFKTRTYATEEACEKEMERLIRMKLKKGYRPAYFSGLMNSSVKMNETLFWSMIDEARNCTDNSLDGLRWLTANLAERPEEDIVKFDHFFQDFYTQSYVSHLWAAAYIITGCSSDECFDHFRAWLLFQGKEIFDAALHNPETLIPYLDALRKKGGSPQLEELLYIASYAYERKTGLDDEQYEALYEALDPNPGSEAELNLDWDEDDTEWLQEKYPGLWELFGEQPLD